jgi:hypothetical protein
MFLTPQRLSNEIQRLRSMEAPVTRLGLTAWVRRREGCTWIAAQRFVQEFCEENASDIPHGTVQESLALTQMQEQRGGLWTIIKPFEMHVRYIFDNGGITPFCRFDVEVSLLPHYERVEIVLSPEADTESIEWFPHLHHGILCGLDQAREQGRELVSIHILVKNIDTHPMATTVEVCEAYGSLFVYHELVEKAVPWTR